MHIERQKTQIESVRHSFWSFFINNWRVTMVVLIGLIIGGLFGLSSLPQESDPEVKIPIGTVTTIYPGASPADVEELITDKLENRLKSLDDLKRLTSSSLEGVSSIVVEFEASADLDESIRELRDEVELAKADLPQDAEDPAVVQIRAEDVPMVTLSVIGNFPPESFRVWGEELEERIESINGVSKVNLSGVEKKEMQVLIDIQKLEGLGLSLNQVVSAIQNNHLDFPVGSILTDQLYYQASLKGQLKTEEELQNLPIANLNGSNVYLRDIADVREVFKERSSLTRLYEKETESYKSSITLQVYKKTGANIIEVVEAAKAEAFKYQQEELPPGTDVLVTNDNSEYIREDLVTLSRSGLQSILIIFFTLFLALGFKEGLLAALSIPLIFLISFMVLYMVGETLNFLVLFSLILSLGLIVDTSIVMIEGVHENLRGKKLNPTDSALLSIHTYRAPLISSTLTTISAFFPMALMTGIMGEYVKHIPITVTITLITSLFVALFLVSALAAHVFKKFHREETAREPILDRFIKPLRAWYEVRLRSILGSKRKRRTWVVGMILASIVTISFPFLRIVKVQMFPPFNANYVVVNVEAPLGATIQETDAVVKKVEKIAEQTPELDNFVTIIGGSAIAVTGEANQSGTGATSVNQASITINLTPKEERKLSSIDISDQLREQVKAITEADVTVVELESGPPGGAPVEIRALGDDIATLEPIALHVEQELKKIEGIRDVTTDIEHGTGEFYFTPKRDQLEFYQYSLSQLAGELRAAVFGNDRIDIIENGEETPIVVRLDYRDEDCKNKLENKVLSQRDRLTVCNLSPKNVDQIKRIQVSTPKGQVTLGQLADIQLNPSVTTIRHRDGKTVINVKAYTEETLLPSEAVLMIQERLADYQLPEGATLQYGGETEDTAESFQSLGRAMILGIMMIAFILVLQFNSFKQPFIIMMTLPLALIGVFTGLALLQRNFSFPGFIGIVALSGVVVNDAIVLIDRINTHVRGGMEKVEAIVLSGKERLQPIILTTVTTATGVLPLAFASEIWEDLAWSIVFGILFATLLTLVMVPIFYNWLEKEHVVD